MDAGHQLMRAPLIQTCYYLPPGQGGRLRG